ncbi:MAG: class I SAM-dependent methyltransferase [Saprospiraceae bacterium]|nr:class I SAM-dependent methyltransferase [Saprospiraceae bacterium]
MMTLIQHMQCPLTGERLQSNSSGTELISASGHRYPLKLGVWQLLLREQRDPSSTSYREHYEIDAEVFDYYSTSTNRASLHESRRLQETITRQIPKNARRILDTGCGNAWLAGHCIEKRPGVEICSMDISTANTRKARQKLDHANHLVVQCDAQAIPFADNTFDVVVASEVLEHVENVPSFLLELYRVTTPGGKLILTTPYNEVIQYSLCIHCNQKTPLHAHLHSVNEKFIRDNLHLAGLDEIPHTKPFLNKGLVLLKTHVLLRHLPYPLWDITDRLANRLLGHQSRLLVVLEKNKAE